MGFKSRFVEGLNLQNYVLTEWNDILATIAVRPMLFPPYDDVGGHAWLNQAADPKVSSNWMFSKWSYSCVCREMARTPVFATWGKK